MPLCRDRHISFGDASNIHSSGVITSLYQANKKPRDISECSIFYVFRFQLYQGPQKNNSVELSCRHIWPDYESHWFGKINNFKINLVNMIHGRRRKTWKRTEFSKPLRQAFYGTFWRWIQISLP